MKTFRKDLEQLINFHSKENGSDTPDFILAEYLNDCLEAFDRAVSKRSGWYVPPQQTNPNSTKSTTAGTAP